MIANALAHISNILFAISLGVSDVLTLRLLIAASQVSFIAYTLLHKPRLWTLTGWIVIFALINLWKLLGG